MLTPKLFVPFFVFLLAISCSAPDTDPVSRTATGKTAYYDQFDPELKPWRAAEERNVEEVFKHYQYYEITYSADGQELTVKHYIKGAVANLVVYEVQPDGSLHATKSEGQAETGRASSVNTLYITHCGSCHGADRFGGLGPALLPSNLSRLGRADAAEVIKNGRPATQMPPYGKQLDAAAINDLVGYLYSPPETDPVWDEGDIRASRIILNEPGSLSDKPVYDADPLNLFMVVEAGDHHVTVLDGDRLEPIYRFATRFALHGGLKFSPDGRYVYLCSRDGWVSKFDLYNLKMIAEVRAGINARNVAVSGNGDVLLVGNYLPNSLVLLKAEDLTLLKVIPVINEQGKTSRVSAVYQAAPRGSFIAALKDLPEVWEITVKNREVAIRRILLERVLDDFFFDQEYRHLIGADRGQDGGQVIDLDSGKVIATLSLPGMPHLGSGITWEYNGRPVMATPNLKEGVITVIDMDNWKVIKRIKTLGPGFFMRSHENTPYAWTDVFFGPDKDVMHVLDKRSLEIIKTLRPEKGKTSGHVEFTRDGRYALVSIWEMDGALVVYDAVTLSEVKRIPMRKPSGKYNAYNKIHRSAGTSH